MADTKIAYSGSLIRPGTRLTGHTVSTRCMLANALGIQAQEPFPDLFRDKKEMDRSAEYPSVQELTRDWNSISSAVKLA